MRTTTISYATYFPDAGLADTLENLAKSRGVSVSQVIFACMRACLPVLCDKKNATKDIIPLQGSVDLRRTIKIKA